MNTNKIDLIKAEVKKLKSQLIKGACSSQIAMETMCKEEAYNEVLTILDSLQEEPVSEDLEKAAEDYGIRQGAELKPFAIKFFKAGVNWKREQIMKDAVEATVTDIRTYKHENEVDFTIMLDKGIIPYETEEELKLIIIKED